MTNVHKGLIAVLVLSSLLLLAGCSHNTVAPEASDDVVTEEVTESTVMPTPAETAPVAEPVVVPGTETMPADGTVPVTDAGMTPAGDTAASTEGTTMPVPAETLAQ